jgi:hypothetical protein
MEIGQNHRLRLSVSMQVLEDTISDVEEIIRSDSQEKIMTGSVNNISSLEKALIAKRIEEIKDLIKCINRKLSLIKRIEESKRRIVGSLTIQFVSLDELKSKRLRGYGEVPDELREFLDPMIDEIRRLISEICEIASPKDEDIAIGRKNHDS